jgi:DNA primase
MSDIDEIKTRLNIVDIVSKRVHLKKTGHNFKGLCPFHNEKSPSFIVSPDRQSFHCFGCGKGGSIFDFVMLTEHVDFVEALEQLAETAGVKLERRVADSPETKMKQKLYEVNHLASEYYHYLLTSHTVGENARKYLKKRGISDKSIKTFTLGYSPNDWDGLLHFLQKKGYDEQLLDTAGLAIRGSRGYYDRFRGRVMFTLKDHRGQVVGFSGRVMESDVKDLPAGRQEPKYINTSETPVYSKSNVLFGLDITRDAIQKADEAILMEGELDVISSFQAGIGNAVAIKGSAVTEGHARLLRRFCERLVFALDSDMAGDAAARRGIEIAERSGFDMRVAHIPHGKDPDEAAREDPVSLKKAIKDAVPIYDYFLSSAVSRYDSTTAFGKRKISEEFFPVLAKIDNAIVQGHYLRELAGTIQTPEDVVRSSLARVKTMGIEKTREKKASEETSTPLSRLEKTEVYMLALLFQGKTTDCLPKLVGDTIVYPFTYPPAARMLTLVSDYMSKHADFHIQEFANSLPAELLPLFDEAYLWDISETLEDTVRFDREWDKAVRELSIQRLKARIAELRASQASVEIGSSAAEQAGEEFAQVSKKLSILEKNQ